MTLTERQDLLVNHINALGDCFDQYTYLIAQASLLPPMKPEDKREENLVKGCQSSVWLKVAIRDGRLVLSADSDTLILRGVLFLIRELVDGRTPEELKECPIDFLQRTELAGTFESARISGIASILTSIRRCAAG